MTHNVGAMLRVVCVGAGVGVHEAILQGAIDQDRQLPCRRGHGLCFADAKGDASIERTEGGLRPPEIHRGES
jgi:hypothetical protein